MTVVTELPNIAIQCPSHNKVNALDCFKGEVKVAQAEGLPSGEVEDKVEFWVSMITLRYIFLNCILKPIIRNLQREGTEKVAVRGVIMNNLPMKEST
jgi:hypothetical protein